MTDSVRIATLRLVHSKKIGHASINLQQHRLSVKFTQKLFSFNVEHMILQRTDAIGKLGSFVHCFF